MRSPVVADCGGVSDPASAGARSQAVYTVAKHQGQVVAARRSPAYSAAACSQNRLVRSRSNCMCVGVTQPSAPVTTLPRQRNHRSPLLDGVLCAPLGLGGRGCGKYCPVAPRGQSHARRTLEVMSGHNGPDPVPGGLRHPNPRRTRSGCCRGSRVGERTGRSGTRPRFGDV